jgi:hypothetical protein
MRCDCNALVQRNLAAERIGIGRIYVLNGRSDTKLVLEIVTDLLIRLCPLLELREGKTLCKVDVEFRFGQLRVAMFPDGVEPVDQLENLPRFDSLLDILTDVSPHASDHHLYVSEIVPAVLRKGCDIGELAFEHYQRVRQKHCCPAEIELDGSFPKFVVIGTQDRIKQLQLERVYSGIVLEKESARVSRQGAELATGNLAVHNAG